MQQLIAKYVRERHLLETSAEVACALLDPALYYSSARPLCRVVLRHIEEHAAAVLRSNSFCALSADSLLELLRRRHFDVPEQSVFDACVRWSVECARREAAAAQQGDQVDEDGTDQAQDVRQRSRQLFQQLCPLIRWSHMDP